MINYNAITINRGVMHHIEQKTIHDEYASVIYERTLFGIEDPLKEVIKSRLTSAAGRESRSFELDIKDVHKNSFFDLVKDLKGLDDKSFFQISKKVASLLCKCQTRNNIPGGAFIILDCSYGNNKKGLYVVIKAELHEAIRHSKKAGKSKLQVLKDIFLSPAQRLYKVGIIYERDKDEEENAVPNNTFGCFLYDEQFRIEGSKPASYFYKDFLGFSVDRNSKIQTKRFFDKAEGFILKSIPTPEEKNTLINILHAELNNLETTISPSDFGKKFIKNDDIRDLYIQNVVNNLPSTIAKDTVLIEGQLHRKKISFPNSIKISGEIEGFDENVKIIANEAEFKELDYDDEDYTIITIKGKPYS
jgi:hypothetical protein